MFRTTKRTNFLYQLLEWIMNLLVINLLWILFNIPVIFLVLYITLIKFDVITMIFVMIGLIILFFPATSAMYASVRECVIYIGSRASLKKYWSYYKENYVRSVGIGLLLIPFWMVLCFNSFYFLSESSLIIFCVTLISGTILFVYNVNIFIINVHYHYSFIDLIINSFFVTFGSIILFFSVIIGFIFVFSLSLLITRTISVLFIVLFSGSLFAVISFMSFYRYYLRYSTKE